MIILKSKKKTNARGNILQWTFFKYISNYLHSNTNTRKFKTNIAYTTALLLSQF